MKEPTWRTCRNEHCKDTQHEDGKKRRELPNGMVEFLTNRLLFFCSRECAKRKNKSISWGTAVMVDKKKREEQRKINNIIYG